ncbi:hypothetical protein C9J85_18590 [Haloferax sp. wsp5]|nr:hypothetical protein C9J85_18590 [Haloferax sp. wsp5]
MTFIWDAARPPNCFSTPYRGSAAPADELMDDAGRPTLRLTTSLDRSSTRRRDSLTEPPTPLFY